MMIMIRMILAMMTTTTRMDDDDDDDDGEGMSLSMMGTKRLATMEDNKNVDAAER